MKILKKTNLLTIPMFLLMCFLYSCVIDTHPLIAVIKNNSKSRILIAKERGEIVTDSILYHERFSEVSIDINKSQILSVPNLSLSSQPDSAKVYLYIFNCDSVEKYQISKKMKGIVKSSFKRKIEIQLNKVKEPLDTIYIHN